MPGARVELRNVSLNPTRTGFLRVVERMGAQVEVEIARREPEEVGTIRIASAPLHGTRIEASEVPEMIDEIPLIGILAAYAEGETEVVGAQELRVKESDRIETLARNLRAMGATIETREDGFVIKGPQQLTGARVDSALDHRIAMAFAIAALRAKGTTTIGGAEAVAISYPHFFPQFEQLAYG